jgi:hypothetical protein
MDISGSTSTMASIHRVIPVGQHLGVGHETDVFTHSVSSSEQPPDYWWNVAGGDDVQVIPAQRYVPSSWDDEEEDEPIKQPAPPSKPKMMQSSTSKNTDASDDDDDESSDDDEGVSAAVKISKHQKMQNLCKELLENITRYRSTIEKQPYTITRKGFTTQNLINESYNIPGFGNFFILLLRAQAFFQAQGQLKVNISKLRQDISLTTTNLRGAILKHDDVLQEKLLGKLTEQKIALQEAEKTINQIKEKNTPLDKVRSALRIIKRGNERAIRFTTIFRNCVCPPEQASEIVPVVEIKAVAVSKKDSKISSLFAMKSLKN